jgi:hypothetical protein
VELLAPRAPALSTLDSGHGRVADLDVARSARGKSSSHSPEMRPVYDIFLTQVARTSRGSPKEEHFRIWRALALRMPKSTDGFSGSV